MCLHLKDIDDEVTGTGSRFAIFKLLNDFLVSCPGPLLEFKVASKYNFCCWIGFGVEIDIADRAGTAGRTPFGVA